MLAKTRGGGVGILVICMVGAFMEAIKDPARMQRVDWSAEAFAPITLRVLLCSRTQDSCDRPRRISKKEALKVCSQVAHPEGRMLATLACLGYSPKAHTRTCPDVWVLVEEMEAMVEEMLKVAPEKTGTGHGPVSLTDAELRGVHALVHIPTLLLLLLLLLLLPPYPPTYPPSYLLLTTLTTILLVLIIFCI